jgi:hypothetical protein
MEPLVLFEKLNVTIGAKNIIQKVEETTTDCVMSDSEKPKRKVIVKKEGEFNDQADAKWIVIRES